MAQQRTSRRLLAAFLNATASVQVAWFYVAYVPSALNLPLYERGLERTPFQQRLLMMYPLRWAHASVPLNRLASRLSAMPAWFPLGVRPEGIVEAMIDLFCIIIAGLIVRSLYQAASRKKLLTPYVYPLTLLMIAATYCFSTMHRLRFVFDLPSMALFSLGLALIYFRGSRTLFAGLFVVATINRETTLFLLILYALQRYADAAAAHPFSARTTIVRKAIDPPALVLLSALTLFWTGWHIWIDRVFAHNPTAAGPRFWLNIGTLLWPTAWAQILCAFAFCAPLCLAGNGAVRDPVLRAWYWILPVWFLFMMRYGILIETRIFGELIPYLACVAALIAEERILRRLEAEEVAPQPASALDAQRAITRCAELPTVN